jgi:hypothetical protein
MKDYFRPAIGIIITTIILVIINQFTEITFIKDYAFLFIVGAMLLGVELTKMAKKTDNEE